MCVTVVVVVVAVVVVGVSLVVLACWLVRGGKQCGCRSGSQIGDPVCFSD